MKILIYALAFIAAFVITYGVTVTWAIRQWTRDELKRKREKYVGGKEK